MTRLLIPNVTPVPNALFEHVFPNLRPGALRVLLAIVRLTYGWQKVSDRISYTQLQKLTGLSREGVNNAVKELGSLITIRAGAKGKGANEYSLNVDVSTGALVRISDQSEKLTSQNRAEQVVRKVDSSKERIPKKEEARKNARALTDKPDSRIKSLFAFWAEQYQKLTGSPYVFTGKKEGPLLEGLLRQFSEAQIKAGMGRFLESDDDWIQTKGGFTIGVFRSQFNRLISTSSRRPERARGTQEITPP